jgi:probable F420-dependent oxidoreductase
MKFGLVTPVVTLTPRGHAAWEETAGPHELREIAQAADQLGYHHLSCSEHTAIPAAVAETRGSRYYDPAATLGFVGAITENIRLLTHVVVLPYHHPLSVAKQYGTLDRLTGGRLILGVGVGSLEEEFNLLELDFGGRGPRYEDGLRALRAALGARRPEYRGTHYEFSDFIVDPQPLQTHVPIWIGGRSARSLRRALTFADGWIPFGLDAAQLSDMVDRARESPAWERRSQPFDIALSPEKPLDLDDEAGVEAARSAVAYYRDIGATAVNLRFRNRSLAHYKDLLARFMQSVATSI